ncbi:unnamed protein product [Euphydryas editha]|uniref:ABC transporter domain-containing protein n=1 Tax=Euphydryas editha TaxID=104508 RepID=A0AAU9TQE7_EUPED|nr:unnamed protein product [Euphydryas editha]
MKGTLKVLLWKHFVVRVKRFIHFPIEILSTMIIFILLFSIKDSLLRKRNYYHYDLKVEQFEPKLLNSLTGPESIFYIPETEFTRLLMSRIEESLAYNFKENNTNVIKKPKIKPVTDESALKNLTEKAGAKDAIVIFQNVSGTWPKKLKYTIRIKDVYTTYSYNFIDDEAHEFFGLIYESFLKLQWAIDSNYLELLTGDKIKQRVSLQKLPYVGITKNNVVKKICYSLKPICWLSLMLVSVFLSARLLDERATGIQELLKMVGVSNNVIGVSHVLNVVPAGLMYCVVGTLLVTVTSQSILSKINPLLIFIMLLLYYLTVIALAFCSSYTVNNSQYGETMAVLMYLLLYIPAQLLETRELARWTLPLCGLLPHVPMHWFWDEVAALQQYGMVFSFADIARSHSATSGSVLSCYLCLILQVCLYFFFAWYLAKVRPGLHGQALPWNFIFQRQFCGIKKKSPEGHEVLLEFEDTPYSTDYFEAAPKDLKVGIKIVNVSKKFEKELALAEVTLNVYKGEITVLLGHNGTGKTTLISIIMGMLKPTEGKVLVEGLDTVTQKDKMQRIIGLCPQHNLFFPYLTVLEHVMFFTLLKGVGYKDAKTSSQALLEQLGLADKSSYQTSQLSGGMKRRLQLACALAGDAKVLVLDEPTSGLDVQTRRGLWDLLLSLRGSRTVLLSTHFMEEAEALGDRVAALHAGRLRCHATTMHLKRALGSGYRLSFTTIGLPDEPAITAVITSKIPEATVKDTSLNSISYNLPSKKSALFPELFNFLKSKKSELGIDCIGIGVSTLDEVFLKLCTDDATELLKDIVDGENIEPVFKTVTGPRLYFRQLAVLLKRQLKYHWSKISLFLLVQVIIPIMMIYGITILNNLNTKESTPEVLNITLDLDFYSKMADRRVLYSVNVSGFNLKRIQDRYPTVNFESAPNFTAALLRATKENILEYNKYLVGIKINDTDATALFTKRVNLAAPVALNLLTNMIATQLLPYADGQTVTTYNYPMESVLPFEFIVHKDDILSETWAVSVVFVMLTTVVNAVLLPCKERTSSARHIHVLAGCAPALHWGATLLTHTLIYTLVLVLPAIVIAVAFEQDNTIDRPDFLVAMFVVLVLGIIAFLALVYIVSFMFEERASCIVLVSMIFFFVVVTPIVEVVRDLCLGSKREYESFDYFVLVLSYVVPPHTITKAVTQCSYITGHNARNDEKPLCYFCLGEDAPGGLMLALAAQAVVIMTIVILTQYGVFNMLFDRVLNINYRVSSPADVDDTVRAERAYVEKTIALRE